MSFWPPFMSCLAFFNLEPSSDSAWPVVCTCLCVSCLSCFGDCVRIVGGGIVVCHVQCQQPEQQLRSQPHPQPDSASTSTPTNRWPLHAVSFLGSAGPKEPSHGGCQQMAPLHIDVCPGACLHPSGLCLWHLSQWGHLHHPRWRGQSSTCCWENDDWAGTGQNKHLQPAKCWQFLDFAGRFQTKNSDLLLNDKSLSQFFWLVDVCFLKS